jgi:hypothetical protein
VARICPSCNKFASIEQGDADLNLEVDEVDEKHGRVIGDVRLVLTSGCCGDDIAETTLEVPENADLEFEHPVGSDDGKHDVTIEDESYDPTDRFDGKPGTPMRYRRHYYGAQVTLTLKCKCGWSKEVSFLVEEAASGFDDV